MTQPNRPVVLHQKDARAIARGHPWVYREAVGEKPRKLANGAVVDVAAPGRAFLGRGVFDAASPVCVRVWTQRDDERIGEELFEQRITAAAGLRALSGVAGRSDAYRLVNAEGDRMPGVLVDRYGEWLTLELQTPSLARHRKALVAALARSVPARGIYGRSATRSVLLAGAPCEDELVVHEPTGRFVVFPELPGKSGLFSDMREARSLFAPLLAGKTFLNLFAHTGAFSAAAAAAGAAGVTSVDLSGRYLAVAERNVELSAPGYAAHQSLAADVFQTLSTMAGEGRTFDAILVDPPTSSSSKKGGRFSVSDRYRPLVRAALRVLAPGGLLACATNFRGIRRDDFLHLLQDAASMDEIDLRVLTVLGQPVDHPVLPAFPEAAYLHFALCAAVPTPEVPWRP